MRLSRRTLLAATVAAAAAPSLAHADDPRTLPRIYGGPDAKVIVTEFFSLTCTHCAAFSREVMPEIRAKLIEPGKVAFLYKDFPLDQLALTAAMVARSLPPERYEPFVTALFASQDRWAFARGVNNVEEIWKTAALAGMDRATFDSAIKDNGLKDFILNEQDEAQKKWGIDSTPTFIINGQKTAGELSFDAFNKLVTAAGA